ncbi:MAG TPA: CPBP family intramembrane metalloprotease, partial [Candidatus Evtepia faecigallinarum]|nr:CPBP family intramembrane metalloprotease [Candidatus Evtepia faecigallinarum]
MGRIRLEQAQKELAIFLLIAFGLPVLMMFPMAILAWQGKDVTAFAAAQMFYPAAGLMLAKLLCEQEKRLLP